MTQVFSQVSNDTPANVPGWTAQTPGTGVNQSLTGVAPVVSALIASPAAHLANVPASSAITVAALTPIAVAALTPASTGADTATLALESDLALVRTAVNNAALESDLALVRTAVLSAAKKSDLDAVLAKLNALLAALQAAGLEL